VPAGHSLLGKVRESLAARRPAKPGRPAALAAFTAKARQHVVTVAALASFDLGAFQVHIPHLGAAPGWAALCVSLLLLDFAVS
jgi:hypothetical protein